FRHQFVTLPLFNKNTVLIYRTVSQKHPSAIEGTVLFLFRSCYVFISLFKAEILQFRKIVLT
ncbi:hypothetical protein, partial [Alistipes sp.]|uniref:hypothetical protein n=1 Tax=Alistipes sp. TaxID=1872444 RepID=UPI0023F475D6